MNPDRPAAQETAQKNPTLKEMRVFAEHLLARREYAVGELHARLLQKWSGLAQIETQVTELLSTLQADGALSDERFAESFIRSRLMRCHGPVKIRAELRQRRVPDAVIAGKLQQLENDWAGLAAAWLSRQCKGPIDFAARAKYYRRLTNRGFSHEQAMEALSRQAQS